MKALVAVAMLAGAARADALLAGDPPPPPPAPPPTIVAPRPPLASDPFADRLTLTPAVGALFRSGDAMAVEASVTRTFDRAEVAASYSLASWSTDRVPRVGATIQRAGVEARYQALRKRVDDLTLDLCAAAGVGWEHVAPDAGSSVDLGDVSLGAVARMLPNIEHDRDRVWFGMEAELRVLIARDDTTLMLVWGFPIGR
jgi:hypothetical protein